MRNGGLNKAKEYAMHFLHSTIFFIRERHLGIDLFGVDFGSLRGNNIVDSNDESAPALIEEASDNEEEGGSDITEDVEEVLGP